MRTRDKVQALRPRLFRRLALTVLVSVVFLWLLSDRLAGLDPGEVRAAMAVVGGWQWLLAILATAVSFSAVARYDLALHQHLATGLAARGAGLAGFAAIAIGQTVGVGVVSGALVRWRVLPELGLAGAMRLSLLVAVSFLMAWAVVTSAVLALVGQGPWAVLGMGGLAGLVLLLGVGAVRPLPWWPNLITQARLLTLGAVDCLATGLALWWLMPEAPELALFLPAFLIALGAGLVSGAPAGLGAFEMVLIALLPGVEPASLLAGVVAWRLCAYAAPALVGAAVAILAPFPVADGPPARGRMPVLAEAGLAAQGDLQLDPSGWVAGRTGHGLVALAEVGDLATFRRAARAEARWPVIYKAGARMAVRARRAGMIVLPIAREAWLDPQRFRLDLPARSGLRRKLRRAVAAGVEVMLEPMPDWAALASVNAAWVAARGQERGFSMGRFDPAYCAGQQVVVARKADRIIAFATFHIVPDRAGEIWTLDLLRPAPDAPEGTAQALVAAALEAAAVLGARRLSLAAVPLPLLPGPALRLLGAARHQPGRGLAQFKEGFAPEWDRLYLAAPSWTAMAVTGFEIWRRIHRPVPLAKLRQRSTQHEDYEFATAPAAWQREGDRPA